MSFRSGKSKKSLKRKRSSRAIGSSESKRRGLPGDINILPLEIQVSQDSIAQLSQKESEKQLQKEDYYNIGKDIISTAGKAPKTCRMGDIYHMIKNRVESMSKYKVQTGRR